MTRKLTTTRHLLQRRQAAQISRRQFIRRMAGVGMMLGLPPMLLSCGGDGDASPAPGSSTEKRTLFFNLAHESPGNARYFLIGGGRRLPLGSMAGAPEVLAQARQDNAFLRDVPDDQITHFIEDALFAADTVTLCHIGAPIDEMAGTWSMSMLYLHIPGSGASHAFARLRAPLALSAKRERYGSAPVRSAQDLRDENALIDSSSHAASLIMLHPDMLSSEPDSAYHIYTTHASTGSFTRKLAATLQSLGPALPQQHPDQPNATGWATLRPLLDANGAPIRNAKGLNAGQIQYQPDWHPSVDQDAANAMSLHINNVKDDASLGLILARGSATATADVNGRIWFRRQGFATVGPGTGTAAVSGENAQMTLLDQSPENGLDITASITQRGAAVHATINFSNTYLRFLGIYLQFLDNGSNVIPLKKIGAYPGGIFANHDAGLDTATEMYATTLFPETTIFGIPAFAGTTSISLAVPKEASRVRILASGLAFNGPNNYPGTLVTGTNLTIAISYGLCVLFIAAGASAQLSGFQRVAIAPVIRNLSSALEEIFGDATHDPGALKNPATWKAIGAKFWQQLLSGVLPALENLLVALEITIGAAMVADALPVVGTIMRAIACAVGAVDLLHTTVDLALSPLTYVKDLVLTHDLSITLAPDPNSKTFPAAATQYKVTAMFEDGTPHVQTYPVSGAPASLPPVVFRGAPLGGQANVKVAFSQHAAQDDILLGKGDTGLIPNNAAPLPDLTIEEIRFPIGPATAYQHQQKTTLASGPQGQPVHVWTPTKTAPAAKRLDNGNQPGDLSALGSITVRQATSRPPVNGYVGYAWRAFSSGVSDCGSGTSNQLDQLANLNTDTAQAQNGYAGSRCGLQSGVRLAYSLLGHGAANFYLDTSSRLIRGVRLDPVPGFDDPASNMAWGKLNFASDALLLHPAGRLVSISAADHQMEILKLADAALPDEQAARQLLARRHAGPGSQPGLLSAPTAAAISADGIVLVLEQGNHRIQALDVGANPVPYFKQQNQPYFLTLTATASGDEQYLDLAVEYTGFLYVLSLNQATRRYRMDIYHPDQTGTAPISTTFDVNAGRLAVDFWRNVYTLNFEVLQFNGAVPAVTEPSVSLWTPCNSGQSC